MFFELHNMSGILQNEPAYSTYYKSILGILKAWAQEDGKNIYQNDSSIIITIIVVIMAIIKTSV